jgi:hypothetical protein
MTEMVLLMGIRSASIVIPGDKTRPYTVTSQQKMSYETLFDLWVLDVYPVPITLYNTIYPLYNRIRQSGSFHLQTTIKLCFKPIL